MIVPRAPERYSRDDQQRLRQEIEQADLQNLKRTGDIDFPHSLTVRTGNGNIGWGTYTPTLTNVADLDASTAYVCQYMRVGNVVTVSGKVDVDPTAGATETRLGLSLPIASNFTANQQLAGIGHSLADDETAAIYADTTNDRAELYFTSVGTASHEMFFTFTYQVI